MLQHLMQLRDKGNSIASVPKPFRFQSDVQSGFLGGDHVLSGGDGILLINEKGYILYANHAAERMFLAPLGGLQGRKFGFPLQEGVTEIDIHSAENGRSKAVMQCSVIPRKRRVEHLVTVRSQGSKGESLTEPGLRSELLSKLFNHSPIGIIVANLAGQVMVWNSAATQMLGWSAQDIVGHELPDTSGEARESLRDIWQRTLNGEVLTAYELPSQKRDDGHLVDLQVWSVLMHNNKGMPSGTLFMLADLTLQRRIKAHLRRAVGHDVLTGLPNRLQFKKQLHRTLEEAKKKNQHLIIFAIGIDRFKSVNKSLGHVEGDSILQQVTQRLTGELYETDLVARTGGDEFSVLLRDTQHVRDGTRVAEKLLQCVREPFDLNGQEMFLTASIGIAAFPHDGSTAEALARAADSAMDRSKEKGGDCCQFFSVALDEKTRSQLFLEQELHHALERDQLYLDYQPQWNLASGELVGVEALLRWKHPELGIVPPATFIPIAESSGLIVSIGTMVLREACLQLRRWEIGMGKALRMSVNVSPRQFNTNSLAADVADAISLSGINPECLELEITESMMAKSIAGVIDTLQSLRKHGVCISIDDFGTGYSSLSYLVDLPIDTLKIDQSFVRGIEVQPGCKAIISSVLALVRGLNLRVIAEGIETESQLEYLRTLGCDEGQGYLMGKPMSAEMLAQLVMVDSRPN